MRDLEPMSAGALEELGLSVTVDTKVLRESLESSIPGGIREDRKPVYNVVSTDVCLGCFQVKALNGGCGCL